MPVPFPASAIKSVEFGQDLQSSGGRGEKFAAELAAPGNFSFLCLVKISGKDDLEGRKADGIGQIEMRSLAGGFEPRCDLVQRLLNTIKLNLSCLGKLLDALRGSLQMVCHVTYDLAATVAEEEHAKSSQQHSQAA